MIFFYRINDMCDENKILINTKKIIRSIKIENQFVLFKIKKTIQFFFKYEFATKKKRKMMIQVKKNTTSKND